MQQWQDINYTIKDEAANPASPGSTRKIWVDAAGRISGVDETIGTQSQTTTDSY